MGWALGLRSRISVAWHMRSGEEQSVQRPSTAQGVLRFRRLALRLYSTLLEGCVQFAELHRNNAGVACLKHFNADRGIGGSEFNSLHIGRSDNWADIIGEMSHTVFPVVDYFSTDRFQNFFGKFNPVFAV